MRRQRKITCVNCMKKGIYDDFASYAWNGNYLTGICKKCEKNEIVRKKENRP